MKYLHNWGIHYKRSAPSESTKIVAYRKDIDIYQKKDSKRRSKLVYLTSGLAELEEAAGLYPRKERIFFECGLVALIRDCHFSLFILFVSPVLA